MLEANNLYKVYKSGSKELHVLKGINLKIDKGSTVAIVGPSGAGKSTLLHILGGLDYPSRGEVFFDKVGLNKLSDNEISKIRNKRIGFVFQFYHLLPEFSVLENVSLPALINLNGSSKVKVKAKAEEILKMVGLGERLSHYPNQLSGGEQQRVAIARALINEPEVLLCDEPTGNLDSQTGSEVAQLLKQLNQKNGMTVVMVTHNEEMAKMADKVLHLRDGVLVV